MKTASSASLNLPTGQLLFGVLSDLHLLDPALVYKMYKERWQIEIVMRYYKSAFRFDETRVHSDYSVIGSEFCDFLATMLTFRLIREFDKVRLLEKRMYSRTMALLRRTKKIRSQLGKF